MDLNQFLLSLGYEDNNMIITPPEKTGPILEYNINNQKVNIHPYVITYENKKSYLNVEYVYSVYHYSEEKTKNRIRSLIDIIKYPNPGKVYDVGWDIRCSVNPIEFSKKDRSHLAISIFKQCKKCLETGAGFFHPTPGDIVGSRPVGIKLDMGFNFESERKGTHQRSILSKKVFSFGDIKDDGMQYAVYGNDLKLYPI